MKKFLLLLSVLGSVVFLTSFLTKPFVSDKFKIFWDENLIAGKEKYLAEQPTIPANGTRPNIIIILADDLGQTDISLYGNKTIETPHLDAIGKNGVTFSEAYISSPVCSPSRAGLLTGRYQQRFGHEFQPMNRYLKNMWEYYGFKYLPKFRPLKPLKNLDVPSTEDRLRQGLPPSEITLADVLKKEGYSTGIIGKWHLGAEEFAKPCNRGFDYSYGFYEAFTLFAPKESKDIVNHPLKGDFMDMHQWRTAEGRTGNCAILRNCSERQEEEKYLTDVLTDEAIAFIDGSEKNPFFLYLPYNAPHVPLQAQKKYYDQFAHIEDKTKRIYAAMIKNLDDEVGRLMAHLENKGMLENTLIFFLSDNGGAEYNGTTDNTPYKGGKLTNFEGGIRVPFMMQWKGKIEANQVYRHPVISLDIFKTVCEVLNVKYPEDRDYDGVNLIEKTAKNEKAHDALYWRSDYNKAIRKDNWKLLINEADNQILLYDLAQDISEKNNIAAQNKAMVESLSADLQKWEEDMIKPLWPRAVNYVYKDGNDKTRFGF